MYTQTQMITGPDHHVGEMCEDVQPCGQVLHHFLTIAHHRENKTSEKIQQFAALGFLWQARLDKNLVARNL